MADRTDRSGSLDVPETWEERAQEENDGGGKPEKEASKVHENTSTGGDQPEKEATPDGSEHANAADINGEYRSTEQQESRETLSDASVDDVIAAMLSETGGKQATENGQEGGPKGAGKKKTSKPKKDLPKRRKPWVNESTRLWGETQSDIRYKSNAQPNFNGSISNGISTGDSPNSGGSEEGGLVVPKRPLMRPKEVKALKSKSSNGKAKAKVPGKVRKDQSEPKAKKGPKLAIGIHGRRPVVKPLGNLVKATQAKAGLSESEEMEKSNERKERKARMKEKKERSDLSKMMSQVRLKGKDEKVPESQEQCGGRVDQPEREANAKDANLDKSKKRWMTFESEAERLAFIQAKKLSSKAKLKALKERQRQRADAALTSAAAKSLKPAPKGTSKAKGPTNAAKAASKHPRGATSSGTNAGGRDKSTFKPNPIGATSNGKRAGGLAPYTPVPKKLKGQVTKKSEVDEQMGTWMGNVNEAEMAETVLPARAGLLSRHGPRTVSQLASMSNRMQDGEGRGETSWADSSYHPSSTNFLSEGRLRYYRVEPNSQSRIASLDTEADAEVISAAMEAGSQVFHSSLVAELERSIDKGRDFNCHQCSQNHSLIRSSTTILLTENEQIATFRSPKNCTRVDEARPRLPQAGPGTHCDVLFIPSGLKGKVVSVFEAVYAQHKGPLRVIVNLGDGAIRDGETVESVRKQLMVLARHVSAVRPQSERELTRVLLPLSLTSKDGRKVVLNSWDGSLQDTSTQLRLNHLNILLRTFNERVGHISGAKDQEAAVLLDTTFFKEIISKSADAGGRMVEKVNYLEQDNHLTDVEGRLHPTKMALFSRIQDILVYINSPANDAKWGYQHFF